MPPQYNNSRRKAGPREPANDAKFPGGIEPETDFIRYALDCAAIVASTDATGTITYVNARFCEISGYSRQELLASNHRMLKSGLHGTAFFRAMYREIAQGHVWHGEICNQRKDGSLYWMETTIVPHVLQDGTIDSYTSICLDITERKLLEDALRTSKESLRRIAYVDPVTGLPNRSWFHQHVVSLVGECRLAGTGFHLGLMDVDAFKEINDFFGHPAGDELLREVARRLSAVDDPRLSVSRMGGDEFGLVLAGATDDEAAAVFERVLERVRDPVRIAETSRRCSASLGVSVYPGHGEDGESMFRAADLALYHAKSLGRDRLECFQPGLRETAERKSELLAEIETGLRGEAFELHYQPIVPVAPGGRVALEALMRWRHPLRGLLPPAAFQEGFADPAVRAALGMFMLERVFRDVDALCARNIPLGRVAINLTNSDFRSEVFLDRFFALFRDSGIGPDRFCVEVTESMFLGLNQKRVEHGLHRLHDAGVEIALDDFGTGHASLTHLRQLPIDRLKIDRSFVANLVASAEDQAIVRGIIDIAHSLGKTVTAEGVETREQVRLLSHMGCDLLQGWYFGKACEAGGLSDVLDMMPPVGEPSSWAGRTAREWTPNRSS
ncbi:EAL domain-containing protein [Pigmentiphaga sp.]|uniref:putative bifunctional diguanylate cyclase/phosphodiesterase n=1 Tax=Pigmentiphaga sp. TaxID=1977564 RepID=UPI00128E7CF4|nr:EAL domain-containing protein [Pigmentiphaga sp.]MPS27710.1 EAL domain-containing protein [Alcaligenaceae bacterium SAGV5]MPS55132.1 EAL domain-containing protein [Alcaligenaceae bacterium SAGV3]MPT58303.1 EAL domain-containing protein [Alcaligenaceae bacterium]